jgi:glutathione S-transferase
MSERPILYGYGASTYTRIARLALMEKSVPFDYVEVADCSGYSKCPEFKDLHPFKKVPVLDHRGLRLYETLAIARYIDAAFEGPALVPADPVDLARMQQIISVYDNYAFRPWVSVIAGERLFVHLTGAVPDTEAIAREFPEASRAAAVLDTLMAGRPAASIDLADLYIVPAMAYLAATPEGARILDSCAALNAWWAEMRVRPSVAFMLADRIEAATDDWGDV